MKYAIISLGGKQFIVEEGTEFTLERQEDPKAEVLFYKDSDGTLIGNPVVKDINVKLSKVRDFEEKTDILRFKSKSRYRRRQGHKQPLSLIKVDAIKRAKTKSKSNSKNKEK